MTSVLIVSPREELRETLVGRLGTLAYQAAEADCEANALEIVARQPPLAILLDWEDEMAASLLQRWTAELDLRHVPIIVLGGEGSMGPALDGGAADHLPWPLERDERLAIRLRLALRRYAELQGLRQLASHDPLTGAINRRAFSERLEYEFAQAQRYGGLLTLAMVDLDHFKQINDTHGHDVGDLVLKQIAGQLARQLRETDTLARYGGEEFVCLLPQTGLAGAKLALERLRESVTDGQWGYTGNPLKVTFSAGIAAFGTTEARAAALLKAADLALYRAKNAGRDCIMCWEPEQANGGEV